MKKTFLFLLSISIALMASAEIHVLSDVKLGEGYFPRFADAETVTYLASENATYVQVTSDAELRVDNENLDLNLYRNGKKIVLVNLYFNFYQCSIGNYGILCNVKNV